MSLFQNLKIGLWNAWILILYFPFHPLIMIVLDKVIGTGEMLKKMGDVPYEKGERRIFATSLVVIFLMLVYSVFLPLKLGTEWFYAGFSIYLAGIIFFLTAIVNISITQLGKPFTKGIYRFSRHPMMVSASITFLGISVATASWIFFLLTVILVMLQTSQAIAEERGCLEIYGDEYRDFMNKTSRWIGIPKSG